MRRRGLRIRRGGRLANSKILDLGADIFVRWRFYLFRSGRQTISVVRSIRRLKGRWCFCDTKRSRSRRPIKLQSWIVALLRRLRTETISLGSRPEAIDLVFKTASGQPIKADYLAKRFKSILEVAGLPRLRLYDLRYAAATIALAAGVSPKVVSEQLGHASTAFTLDTHAHVLPHMQDETVARTEAGLVGIGV